MFRNVLGILVGSWLAVTPLLWEHRPETAIASFLVGATAFLWSARSVVHSKERVFVAIAGYALFVSVFLFPDHIATMANNLTAAMLLAVAGLAPTAVSVTPARAAALQRTSTEKSSMPQDSSPSDWSSTAPIATASSGR